MLIVTIAIIGIYVAGNCNIQEETYNIPKPQKQKKTIRIGLENWEV